MPYHQGMQTYAEGAKVDWRTSFVGYPGDETGPQKNLIKYWRTAIAWRAKGAFTRCVAQLGPKLPPKYNVEGMCANLHKYATGKWPTEGKHHGK